MSTTTANELRDEVRRRYAESARAVDSRRSGAAAASSCCQGDAESGFGEALYDLEQRGELPDAAALASLGCGNPTAVAELHEGETVLDLGSGGGIDVILSAKRVGPTGRVFGLDMTDEMLALARAERGGRRRLERDLPQGHHRGRAAARRVRRRRDLELRHQPFDGQGGGADGDGARAQAGRARRRLRHRGRGPPLARGARRARLVRRLHRGRALEERVRGRTRAAGFDDVSVKFTHEVADGMHGAIVKAVRG